ncbi:hypothetical protein [Haladaptatus sp. NG-SE-30]
MSAEKVNEGSSTSLEMCPWCEEIIEQQTNDVTIGSPDSLPPSYTWHLHTECAAEWREYVTHLRTLSGRGAFRTLVEEPLLGDVNEMIEWNDS